MRKNVFIIFLLSTSCGASWQESLKSAKASRAYYAEDYDNAAVCYEALLVDNPLDKQAIRGVADCLYAKKGFEDAEKYYRQLIMRLDNDEHELEVFYFNHGCSLAQLKNFKDALISFEAAVKINAQDDRAQKNIEILKKLLKEQKNKDSQQQQDQNDNQDKKDQNNKKQDQQDNQNQQDKQNQNDQNDDQKNQSDKSDSGQLDKEKQKQDKKDQNDLDKEREKDNGQQDQKQPDQQKEQKSGKPKEQQQRNEQEDKGEGKQQQPHNASPKDKDGQQEKPQQVQGSGKKQEEQKLPAQMQSLLQQAGELEKHGQQLYLRALAGQEEASGADHAW